jgi:hypothetical protein
VSLAAGALRALGGASVIVSQWGVSPYNETAGGAARRYAALPSASEDAAAQLAASAAGILAAPRRIADALVNAAVSALVSAAGGTTATQAANSALLSRFPKAKLCADLLPARALDSRVVELRASRALPPDALRASPIRVTLPLRDLSIVQWDARAARVRGYSIGADAFPRLSINVTCPRSAAATTAEAVFSAGGAGRAAVRVEAVIASQFSSVVSSSDVTPPVSGDLAAFADASASSKSALAISAGDGGAASSGNGSDAAGGGVSAAAPVISRRGLSFVLSTDCGPAFGRRGFVCGDGTDRVEFTCPRVEVVPTCVWWNAAARAWDGGVCTVASVDATSVSCDCSQPGAFAARFVALEKGQTDVFASSSPAPLVTSYGVWWPAIALLATFFVLHALGALLTREAPTARVAVMGGAKPAARASALSQLLERVVLVFRAARSAGEGDAAAHLAFPKAAAIEPRAPSAALIAAVAFERMRREPPAMLLTCARTRGAPPSAAGSAPAWLRFVSAVTSGALSAALVAVAYSYLFAQRRAGDSAELPRVAPAQLALLAILCAALSPDAAITRLLGAAGAYDRPHASKRLKSGLQGVEAALADVPTSELVSAAADTPPAARAAGAEAAAASGEGPKTAEDGASADNSAEAIMRVASAQLASDSEAASCGARAALGAIFSLLSIVAILFVSVFTLARGEAAATMLFAAWVLHSVVVIIAVRPLTVLAWVAIEFSRGARAGAVVGGWDDAVSLPLRAHVSGKSLSPEVAVVAYAPVAALAAAWAADADALRRWGAIAKIVDLAQRAKSAERDDIPEKVVGDKAEAPKGNAVKEELDQNPGKSESLASSQAAQPPVTAAAESDDAFAAAKTTWATRAAFPVAANNAPAPASGSLSPVGFKDEGSTIRPGLNLLPMGPRPGGALPRAPSLPLQPSGALMPLARAVPPLQVSGAAIVGASARPRPRPMGLNPIGARAIVGPAPSKVLANAALNSARPPGPPAPRAPLQ